MKEGHRSLQVHASIGRVLRYRHHHTPSGVLLGIEIAGAPSLGIHVSGHSRALCDVQRHSRHLVQKQSFGVCLFLASHGHSTARGGVSIGFW